jgi:hypothetical protein
MISGVVRQLGSWCWKFYHHRWNMQPYSQPMNAFRRRPARDRWDLRRRNATKRRLCSWTQNATEHALANAALASTSEGFTYCNVESKERCPRC